MGKLLTLDDLARTLEGLRERGKTVVHSHGVYDLLHIGHIRHLEQARRLGDVLVVTVTEDQHVNKGPHRPAFPQALRAEAVAALGVVDYVALNRWPTAVETIRLLRPHVYVKGADYRNPGDDLTGKIVEERHAVEGVGGRIAFTEDISFSSSSLLNRFMPSFSEELASYLGAFRQRHREDQLLGYLEAARRLRPLVVGETIVDEYQRCESMGKSAKEPILAVKYLDTEQFPGGTLAVANHLTDFCDQVGLVSLLGEVDSMEPFVRRGLWANVRPTFLYKRGSPTIVKRRFVEHYLLQKLFEVYHMNDDPLDEAGEEALCAALREEVPRHDLVVVADYGHGMMGRRVIDLLCREARFLAVNTQVNAGNLGFNAISKYPRADYVCISEREMRLEVRDRGGNLHDVVLDVARRLRCPRVLVTRGKFGCVCYDEKDGFVEVPAFAGQVVDRIGAGDAVLAITSLCVAQGAPMEAIGFIGNAVGAQAVTIVGNRSPIRRTPLVKHIVSLLK